MANCAYLVASELARIYPSFENPAFDPEQHTLAICPYGVPVMWLGLFRIEDVTEETFLPEGGASVAAFAPVTTLELARHNARHAAARFDLLFDQPGTFAPYAELIVELLDQAAGEFVTIELEEIACLHEAGVFRGVLERVLRFLAGEPADSELRTDLMNVVAGLDATTSIPRWTEDELAEEDEECVLRILGGSYLRAVPWH